MTRDGWKRLTARLAGSLFSPAPDPRKNHSPPDRFAATLERIDAAISSTELIRRLLKQRIGESGARLANFKREIDDLTEASCPDADFLRLLRERQQLALREQQFLSASLDDVQAELRRLAIIRDRLRMQAETLALRHELASARRSAAQARFDAGESMLDFATDSSSYDVLLADAEEQAAEAEARADVVEQMLASWTEYEDW